MGFVSTSEDIEQRKADLEFCEHKIAPDLRALLLAPVEHRRRLTRSAPAPMLRARIKKEKKRAPRAIRSSVARQPSQLISENARLREYACAQARIIGRGAPYFSFVRTLRRGRFDPQGTHRDLIKNLNREWRCLIARQIGILDDQASSP
jgi:hypothetical protein